MEVPSNRCILSIAPPKKKVDLRLVLLSMLEKSWGQLVFMGSCCRDLKAFSGQVGVIDLNEAELLPMREAIQMFSKSFMGTPIITI